MSSYNEGGILWQDSYCIGVEEIDAQHKELFSYATENLLDIIETPEMFKHKHRCVNSIKFLKEYVVEHFKDEEEYQEHIGYPEIDAHRQDHIRLASDVARYEKMLVESNFSLPIVKRFLAFVVYWLTHHVGEADRRIGEYSHKRTRIKRA